MTAEPQAEKSPIEIKPTICPSYIKGSKICEKYVLLNGCPIGKATYDPAYDLEGRAICNADGIVTPSEAKNIAIYIEEQKVKHETSRLIKINESLTRLNSERESKNISSQVSAK